MRLPNGFGSVYKLSGNRRKPYVAQKTIGYDENSKRQYKIIGYYETKEEGLIALSAYNANPYTITSDVTFAEVYKKWSERKYQNISRSNANGYKAAYKLCESFKNMKIKDIRLSLFQSVVDNSGKNYPLLTKFKMMLNQIFDYAVLNDIISQDHNKIKYLDIGKSVKSDMHYRFTESELDIMWKWSESPSNIYIRLILILIYSGVRPGELFNVRHDRVDLEKGCFYIDKGKNDNAVRQVPIHDKVMPFFKQWYDQNNEYLITQQNGDNFKFSTNHKNYVKYY
ncbi:MAG: tyrosine-type recombinase/integrase [Candidatus Ornithomonoglobus sp.]